MKVKELKLILEQYNNEDLIYIELSPGACYKISHGDLRPSKHDDDYFEIRSCYKDPATNSPILDIE